VTPRHTRRKDLPAAMVAARRRRIPSMGGSEQRLVKALLIGTAILFLLAVLVVPLLEVFLTAFRDGPVHYWEAISDSETANAIRLTLIAVAISVPLNTLFGIAAAMAITRWDFPGKRLLVSFIDIPFAVSPVISGMIFVLLFGADSLLGPWLGAHGVKVIFAVPGIVLVTMFVTFPFVARELIPVMQMQGSDHELAALTLGASPLQTFFRVTLPNIRWGLFYGMTLCAARAVGEFGAVSVVSGHIRGETNTMPLHVEVLYNEYQFSAAFAVATLLVIVAILTLGIKAVAEWKEQRGHHR